MLQVYNIVKKKRLLLAGIPLMMGFSAFIQENHPPVVRIRSPRPNSVYPTNSPVRFEIEVSDKEDGESKFQEIPPNEVFLEVSYFADSNKAALVSKLPVKGDPPGLLYLKSSNCLNCHAFNAKLIGPSFYDISKRYPLSGSHVDTLSKRILEGSTGVWGNITMPTHPELTKGQTMEIVRWILKNASNPAVNYYSGTEGSFLLKPPSGAVKNKGVYLLVARYTDHGTKDNPQKRLSGQDVVLIRPQ